MTQGFFRKMHGLGNDFVVLDVRDDGRAPDIAAVRRIADRHRGVGCDQVIVVERSAAADAFMRIFNADGSEVAACGNASRCVAALLMAQNGRDSAVLETAAGLLACAAAGPDRVQVDMGPPRLGWQDLPLAHAADTLHLPLALEDLAGPVGVSMGNPHAVFFVPDAEAVPLARLGPVLEHDALFPQRCNIEVVQVLAPDRLRMRVWERGAGITQACGTGACASAVAAMRRSLVPFGSIAVELDGGRLDIAWAGGDAPVSMTGPVELSFEGRLAPGLWP